MSEGEVPLPSNRIRYVRGDVVRVGGEVDRVGVVVRERGSEYTIRFGDGTRCHAPGSQLSRIRRRGSRQSALTTDDGPSTGVLPVVPPDDESSPASTSRAS